MEWDWPTDEEIDRRMRRACAARIARHLGYYDHAREIENGMWDNGVAMTRMAPFFEGVILIGRSNPNRTGISA